MHITHGQSVGDNVDSSVYGRRVNTMVLDGGVGDDRGSFLAFDVNVALKLNTRLTVTTQLTRQTSCFYLSTDADARWHLHRTTAVGPHTTNVTDP